LVVSYRLVQSHPNMISGDPKKARYFFSRHGRSTMRKQPIGQIGGSRRHHLILLPLSLSKVTYIVTLDKLDVNQCSARATYLGPLTIKISMQSAGVLTATQDCTNDLTNRMCMSFAT
jgi:hypothetical protein